ncbi:MAG: ABC transporter permease, partial [Planctomycetaceae bacterium]|nr:ABC transporter permease [Planctomycetaceae bacterium]
GLATILISGLLLAIWTSSTSIASEIEGKTAMTLLSKPINRRQFILGKYFGILQSTLALVLPMALAFLLCIYFKVPYDARESGGERLEMFDWSYVLSLGFTEFRVPMPGGLQIAEIVLILPGIALVILEIAVMAAIAVAISTRLPMVANMVTCLTIFVIGHLTPILVEAGVMKVEFVKFMAQLIATVLPSLEVFNISAAIATSVDVPPAYLGGATVFCAAYSTAAILFAFILFEDRDLA